MAGQAVVSVGEPPGTGAGALLIVPAIMLLLEDEEAVELTARETVARHGDAAPGLLRERAAVAGEFGDALSAEAWREIADAAERLLSEG